MWIVAENGAPVSGKIDMLSISSFVPPSGACAVADCAGACTHAATPAASKAAIRRALHRVIPQCRFTRPILPAGRVKAACLNLYRPDVPMLKVGIPVCLTADLNFMQSG